MSNKSVSIYEFLKKFPDEQSAIVYLEARRWPNGVACPTCGSLDIRQEKDYRYKFCRDCYLRFTVRTGTIFARSHIPLHKWLFAIYVLQQARKGVSSIQLSKELGISQKACWFMLHRLREACEEHKALVGTIEIDETYVGGKMSSKRGDKRVRGPRGAYGKQPVLGMRERDGHTTLKVIPDTTMFTLEKEIRSTVTEGSTVYTDEYRSYNDLSDWYSHDSVKHSKKEYARGDVTTNSIESVWALLKRGYHGIFHHYSVKHMQLYANEIAFRLNHTTGDVMAFINDLLDLAFKKRLTFKQLTA